MALEIAVKIHFQAAISCLDINNINPSTQMKSTKPTDFQYPSQFNVVDMTSLKDF